MGYSIIPKYKYGNCSCGCGGRDVAGRKVGSTFHCLESYQRMKSLEQLDKDKKRNALRTDGRKLRGQVEKGQNDLLVGRNQIILDLDWTFSRLIRIMYSDADGLVTCFTCPTKKHFSLMQCGHYISRKHIGLRYDLRNGRVQCEECNCHKQGNLEVYKKRLEAEHKGLPEQLYEQSNSIEKPSNNELQTLLIQLRSKLKIVESKLNNTKK